MAYPRGWMIHGSIEKRRVAALITPWGNFRTQDLSSSYERVAGKVTAAISVQSGLQSALLSPLGEACI
jgi:hypothetical protein